MTIKRKHIHDVFFLITAHEDVLVTAPSSRGAPQKMKPSAVLDYKYKKGVDRSDQMLSYYSFERKTNGGKNFLSPIGPGSGQFTLPA